jgi:hypothetical protein
MTNSISTIQVLGLLQVWLGLGELVVPSTWSCVTSLTKVLLLSCLEDFRAMSG